MRYKLYFNLENENISIQYRKSILSFIKKSLQEYDEEQYKKFYNERDNIIKPFTFAVFFKDSKFNGDNIIVNSKSMELNMSTEDYNTGIVLYNAFNHQRNKKFSLNNNSMTLKNMVLLPEKEIDKEEIIIKFLSPLVVRSRIDNKDYYYSYSDSEFLNILKLNIKMQLKISDLPETLVENLNIEPITAKKTVVKFYEKQIEASLGTFKLSGNIDLLNYLYKVGIGSKHSAGFGMFEVI
ncbi:MAG: CRISPR-associated endoribonuclease Cas6 [Clostridia bacterium]|nr:CRISPR-associated endoribonuclease Cas6 [Clostridia bacterium]